MSVKFKWLCLLILLQTLLACSGGEGDDLDKFIASEPANMSTEVESLPQVQTYVPLIFNADGALFDPFKPRVVKATGKIQPDLNRPKELLEAYPLENLQYVGALSKRNTKFALIKTPDNVINKVTVGHHIGLNYGLISAIGDNEITVKEIIQDDLTGDWVERVSSISLQE
jgi:type IV pilus assembly protein PilP